MVLPGRTSKPGGPADACPVSAADGAYSSPLLNNFYNVKIQPEGFAINVYFQYLGKSTPIFAIGKTANIGWSVVASIPAKNMNNGYWLARIETLTPGTLYYLQLSDPQSTWLGTAKTYRRRHDVCSGEDIVLSDAEGRWIYDGWTAPFALVKLNLLESDSCSYFAHECGDIAWGAQGLWYDVSGGVKSYVFKLGVLDQSYPKVVWEGTVKTTFVP